MNVAHASIVWLPVRDLGRAVEFYCHTLGLQEKHRDGDWAEVEASGLRIGLNAHEQPGGRGGAVIAFEPEEPLDTAVDHLREQGVNFAGEISEHPWGRIASFEDPDGNDLQLYEPPRR